MRLLLFTLIFLSNSLAFAQQKKWHNSFVRPLPVPARNVNDFSKFLTSTEIEGLENELVRYWKASTNAIVIVTLDSLTDKITKEQYTIEQAAYAYFNSWGIGDSSKNNGVLIIASRSPRRVRIEVGKGLENALTNPFCQQIINNQLIPAFKERAFSKGFLEAVKTIENKLDNTAIADNSNNNDKNNSSNEINPDAIPPYAAQPDVDSSPLTMGIIGFLILGGLVFIIVYFKNNGGEFSDGGYRDRNIIRRSGTYHRRSIGSSGNSSSSSSSSGSFGGGSSNGGGASGSW